MKRVIPAILVLTLAAMACQLPGTTTPLPQPEVDSPQPVSVSPILLDGSLTSLYEGVIPGVVAIRAGLSQGSGFVFDNQGHIVTNQHVIEGATTVEISFSTGFKAISAGWTS